MFTIFLLDLFSETTLNVNCCLNMAVCVFDAINAAGRQAAMVAQQLRENTID